MTESKEKEEYYCEVCGGYLQHTVGSNARVEGSHDDG